jgi:hypothetical protein
MAKFTVRVELHAANEDDYENLHSAKKLSALPIFVFQELPAR